MATYVILNIVFMAVVVAALKYIGALRWDKTMARVLIILIILTALFDSLIIAANIVEYDTTKLLGIFVGRAPIEDFMYATLALIIIPTLWKKLEVPRVK